MINKELKEQDLQLVVSEKTFGTLVTNAVAIRDTVKNGLQMFHVDNYDETNIDVAKKDKALLNNAAKVLNNKRIELEREFMQPFNDYKEVANETVKLISECSSKIDALVKQVEGKEKQKKRKDLENYFAGKYHTLVSFEQIFDEKWLNKNVSYKKACEEIDAKINKINEEVAVLKTSEDAELLISLYLEKLDIGETLRYANTLKQNRAKAKADEQAKKENSDLFTDEEKSEISQELAEIAKSQVAEIPAETIAETPATVASEADPNEMLTRIVKIVAKRKDMALLMEFLTENNFDFERVD